MSESTVQATVTAEYTDAMSARHASKLSMERVQSMEYYLGNMEDMPYEEGRSQAISSDVQDVVEGLMPALMEIFCGSDEVVEFEAVGPQDEEAASQETDYVNHVFMQQNNGFMVLYEAFKDALLLKTGIFKVWWETGEMEERETYLDQSDDQFALLSHAVEDPDNGLSIVEHAERPDAMAVKQLEAAKQQATQMAQQPGPMQQQAQVGLQQLSQMPTPMLHDVTVARNKPFARARVMTVPPEEFGIARRARSLSMDDCTYCFHEVYSFEAKLLAEGFDADQVKRLPSSPVVTDQEQLARNTVEQNRSGDSINEAARPIKVCEHYIRLDYEGDGKPGLYRVTTASDQLEILRRDGKPDVVRIDDFPLVDLTPIPQPHRFFGRSIADIVMDIQRIKTALLRALLDNAYLANSQRLAVSESHSTDRTLDDLLINRPGGIVRVRAPGGIENIPNETIGNFVFPLLEYIDTTRDNRTGVNKQGMGIDPNALQNQTATAVNQAFTAAAARMKLIARIFAETGVRNLMGKLHEVIRKNDREQRTVKLRNKWVTVDPRGWKTRDDMTVNVGLGSGSKDQQFAHIMAMLNIQKEAMQIGLVGPDNIFNSIKKAAAILQLKNPDLYVTDPHTPQGQQMVQQAAQMMAQAHAAKSGAGDQQFQQGKLQIEASKAQAKQQHDIEKLQLSQQALGAKVQTDHAKLVSSERMHMAKTQTDAALSVREQNLMAILKKYGISVEAELEHEANLLHAHVAHNKAKLDAEVRMKSGAGNASNG